MASETQVLRREDGVALTKVSLRQNGQILSCSFFVSGKHTPQTWQFDYEDLAIERFEKEVDALARGAR